MNDFLKIDSFERDLLFTHVTGLSRARLHAHPERVLNTEEAAWMQRLVQRRIEGEPIAYILGYQPFWSLDLKVTADTLIPRPETECLVEWILQHYAEAPSQRVLDLGTGSGAIALALACERSLWQIEAVDISAAALEVARENAGRHGLAERIVYHQGDWYKALPEVRPYSVIVSNPPYICADDVHLKALRYEPHLALVADKEGLGALERVVAQGPAYLIRGGCMVVEHGYNQAEAVLECFYKTGYSDINLHRDLAGHPRFVTGIWRDKVE